MPKANRKLKLQPELVPLPLWGINACQLLRRRSPWRQIRNATLEKARYRCSVCSEIAESPVCHERWHYDDKSGIARLEEFVAVCRACNFAIHPGVAGNIGQGDAATTQLCHVNGITREQADRIVQGAMRTWEKRNGTIWRVVVAAVLLKAYPVLEILERQKPRVHDFF